MYIIEDVAYAGEPVEGIEVSAARYVGDRIFLIMFSTGETRLFDASCLPSLPAFKPLADEAVLREFGIDHGVLTWCDGEIDIAPEALYERNFEYQRIA